MENMFEFPVVPAVLLSAFLLGSGCYFIRKRSPFVAICEWLWAFVLLALCAVDLFMQEKVWPSLATVLVVGVCEAVILLSWVATPLAKGNTSEAGRRDPKTLFGQVVLQLALYQLRSESPGAGVLSQICSRQSS